MKYQIFIDGAEGTTGLKIHRYFENRKDVNVLSLQGEKRKDVRYRLEMVDSADVSFLCLPDEAAREIVALASKEARIIDTSTAHRTASDWVYGLPELEKERREKIRGSRRIAVPGCHATGMILLTRPLMDEGIINSSYPICGTSLTGFSGGGKKMIADYRSDTAPESMKSPGIYGLTQVHKHLPEIVAMTGLVSPPVFLPVVGDYYSGMVVTIPLHIKSLEKKITKSDMVEIFKTRYEGEAFIEVMETEEETKFLYGNEMADRYDMRIYISGNDERVTLSATYDNLGKGASGAAIQNMNIMLGIEEGFGLLGNKDSEQ